MNIDDKLHFLLFANSDRNSFYNDYRYNFIKSFKSLSICLQYVKDSGQRLLDEIKALGKVFENSTNADKFPDILKRTIWYHENANIDFGEQEKHTKWVIIDALKNKIVDSNLNYNTEDYVYWHLFVKDLSTYNGNIGCKWQDNVFKMNRIMKDKYINLLMAFQNKYKF